jgi:cyclase
MLSKRVILCLDVRNGLLTKGVKFKGNVDIGDPVEAALRYYLDGADEIVFYDITASAEDRSIILQVVELVAENIFIPFSVGGGISSVARMRDVLLAGAEKISVNSAAVRYPGLISEGAEAFGSQAVVLGLDAKKVEPSAQCPSGYEVVIDGGRTPTGLDALAWARKAESLGAGEICLNSIDADGTLDGYELDLTCLISSSVEIPVIASGGAGNPDHLHDALTKGKASAALVASIVHYGTYSIRSIKERLLELGLAVRLPKLSRERGGRPMAPGPAGPEGGGR